MLRSLLEPMEALSVEEMPRGEGWQYEPKWDGFRCIAIRDGNTVTLQSKALKPLTRYFPELVESLQALKAKSFMLDGEIVVPEGKAFSFDALLQRIHPAASRIKRLSEETPALFIVFDLLAAGDSVIRDMPLAKRRPKLEAFAKKYFQRGGRLKLSPATTRPGDAKRWLDRVGGQLDGIIAKRLDLPYRAGERDGMQKIKNYRSADCVVGGFRYNEGAHVVGSLLLGLYDEHGVLHHVGFTSSIAAKDKPALTKKLEPLIGGAGFTGKAPGGPSRWSTRRSDEWQPLKPKLVVEVCYDHFSGDRFRHGTRLMRWRPDKSPRQCRLDQVTQKKGNLLSLLTA
jgi:ATP-dependent DNA ligase